MSRGGNVDLGMGKFSFVTKILAISMINGGENSAAMTDEARAAA
jgi:hypothetical protein